MKLLCLLLVVLSVGVQAQISSEGSKVELDKATNYNELVEVVADRLKKDTLKIKAVPMGVSSSIEPSDEDTNSDLRIESSVLVNGCIIYELDTLARNNNVDVAGYEDVHSIHLKGQLTVQPIYVTCKVHFNYTQDDRSFQEHWKLHGYANQSSVFNFDMTALLKSHSLMLNGFSREKNVKLRYLVQAPRELRSMGETIEKKLPQLITVTINEFLEQYLREAIERVTLPLSCGCYSTEKQRMMGNPEVSGIPAGTPFVFQQQNQSQLIAVGGMPSDMGNVKLQQKQGSEMAGSGSVSQQVQDQENEFSGDGKPIKKQAQAQEQVGSGKDGKKHAQTQELNSGDDDDLYGSASLTADDTNSKPSITKRPNLIARTTTTTKVPPMGEMSDDDAFDYIMNTKSKAPKNQKAGSQTKLAKHTGGGDSMFDTNVDMLEKTYTDQRRSIGEWGTDMSPIKGHGQVQGSGSRKETEEESFANLYSSLIW